jgi:hypothetical protein
MKSIADCRFVIADWNVDDGPILPRRGNMFIAEHSPRLLLRSEELTPIRL